MTTLLFPPDKQRLATLNAPQKRLMYPVVLADIIRAASDSVDALMLFGNLITRRQSDPDTVGYMAFDGHIGDTSCQLRACMMRELVLYHRRILQHTPCPTEYPHWVTGTIYRLQELVQKAKSTCLQLTKDRVDPQKLGLSNKSETRIAMLQKLGWMEPKFEIVSDEYDAESDSGGSDTETESPDGTPTHSSSRGSSSTAPIVVGYGITDFCCSTSAFNHCSKLDHTSKYTSSTPLWLPWSLTDVGTILRFLTYTYSLSKYKRFGLQQIRDSNTSYSNRLVMRLEPDIAASYGIDLLAGIYDPTNPHYNEKLLKKSQRINTEFLAAQGWVSEVSCAWLAGAAENLGNLQLRRLLAETSRTSAKGLVSVPSYVGYLVLREYWARDLVPNLIVDRRFCKDGFHINYFLARPQLIRDESTINNPHATLGMRVHWSLQHIKDANALELSQDPDTPHIVVMGNSLNGSFSDYMNRFQGTCEHTDSCEDNHTHIEEFLASDQDRLSLAIFADHPHYAFPLVSKEEAEDGEIAVVAAAMEKVVPGLAAQWQKAKNEIVTLGAGQSLKMFMWQHVLLESGSRVIRMLNGRTSIMPLTAAV
ncbi:hypothetical protein EV426DRAFT_536704 [Tirmania nivea]|nr:hypothetical protein EV426DRAFT_536704 [Tirmania nivea]